MSIRSSLMQHACIEQDTNTGRCDDECAACDRLSKAAPMMAEALRALLIAVDCDTAQGGSLSARISKANPLTVESARAALKAAGMGD